MAATPTQVKRMRFAIQLRQALDANGKSVRSVARELNPLSPETARSNLMRWLRGSHMPSRTSRRAVAVVLGLAPEHFESDDDEESDPVSDLMDALRRFVRDEMNRARA